jgi:hypothetical protein
VKAVGELDVTAQAQKIADSDELDAADEEEDVKEVPSEAVDGQSIDPHTYIPMIVKNEATGVREWLISETDIDFLSKGKLTKNSWSVYKS